VAPRRLTGAADTYAGYRARLVETLRARGIRDLAVLKAFAETPRHLFVPPAVGHRAYEDTALRSQRSDHLAAIHPGPLSRGAPPQGQGAGARNRDRLGVSDRPAGGAFRYGLLGRAGEALAVSAQRALREAGIANVSVLLGDGTLGWSAYAPYNAILVAAAARKCHRRWCSSSLRTAGC